jgi:hypothetical protein
MKEGGRGGGAEAIKMIAKKLVLLFNLYLFHCSMVVPNSLPCRSQHACRFSSLLVLIVYGICCTVLLLSACLAEHALQSWDSRAQELVERAERALLSALPSTDHATIIRSNRIE